MNGGRNYDNDRCSSENKIWLFAGNPVHPVLLASCEAVTKHLVRAISRKDIELRLAESSETARQTPQERGDETVRAARRRAERVLNPAPRVFEA